MLTPIDAIAGDCDEDTRRLKDMAVEAWNYVTGFEWSRPVTAASFADGVGGVVALFLFEFEGAVNGTDDRLWVVVGDLPSAYMTIGPETPRAALETYCELMDAWADTVDSNGDFSAVFPVEAVRTPEIAAALRRRLAFLRREIIPTAPTCSINAPQFADGSTPPGAAGPKFGSYEKEKRTAFRLWPRRQ